MKKILIVDDNMASLKQIAALLSSDYEVSLVKSGALALKFCAQEKPDLILLDVEMPEMDGFETHALIKKDPALTQIPIIYLTGNNDTATELRALESGAVDFVAKPPNRSILQHRIELHLQLAEYQHSLEETVSNLEDSIVFSFAELIECKDENSGLHVLRTSKFAELLAQEIYDRGIFGDKLTQADVENTSRAAPFHDIGKIGVSDTYLQKEGELTPEEYEEVKKHTVIGADVIRKIYKRIPDFSYFEYAIHLAEWHHERYDGKGYPYGLGNETIPIYTQIFSVVNAYDAYRTDRSYRKGFSHDEACRLIIKGRGTEFDPQVVDVFDSIKDRFDVLKQEMTTQEGKMAPILPFKRQDKR